MSIPLVSVVVPVYNVEEYLPQCVESILTQRFKDFELILVNDGSTDQSLEICNSYANNDKRIVVLNQDNKGVSTARNNGLEHARGAWVVFVDADDWVDSDYLEFFHFDEDDADLIIQGLEYYDCRNEQFFKQIRVENCIIEGINAKQKVAANNLLRSGYPVAKAYKRSIIDKGVRFNSSISYHEDHIFVLEALALASKIRLSDSVSYKYRYFHMGSSLSSMKHSWINLGIAADGMIKALNNLHDKYLVSGSQYERQIYNFAIYPKIKAAIEIWEDNISNDEKRIVIQRLINPPEMDYYYNPFSLKEKLIKRVLCYAPLWIQRVFFILYKMIQKR